MLIWFHRIRVVDEILLPNIVPLISKEYLVLNSVLEDVADDVQLIKAFFPLNADPLPLKYKNWI